MQESQWDVSPCRHLLIKWIIGNWEHKGGGDSVIRLVTLPWWGDITITSTGQMTWSPVTRRYTPAKVKVGVTLHLNTKYLSLSSVLSDVLLNDTRTQSFVQQMVIWSYWGHPHLRSGHWYCISRHICISVLMPSRLINKISTPCCYHWGQWPLSLCVLWEKLEFTKNIWNFTLSLSASVSIQHRAKQVEIEGGRNCFL